MTVAEQHLYQEGGNPVRFDDVRNQWGFWDETWTDFHGGFTSRSAATKGLIAYARFLETNSQGDYYRSLPRSEHLKSQKDGWRNWFINRGRLPLEGDHRIERQISWRRVF